MIENERVLKSAKGTDIRRQRIYGTAEIPCSFCSWLLCSSLLICISVCVCGGAGESGGGPAKTPKLTLSTKFGVEAPISPQHCM